MNTSDLESEFVAPGGADDLPDQLVVTLAKPILMGNGTDVTTFENITLRSPTVDELSQFVRKSQKENEVDAMKFLVSIVSGAPLAVVGKMGVRNFYEAQDYLLKMITPPEEDGAQGNVAGSR